MHPPAPIDSRQRQVLVRRLAAWCTGLVLTITTLSAFIRLSGSPPPYPAVIDVARMLHRITAIGVLGLVMFMVLVCMGQRLQLRRQAATSVLALLLVVALAVLGRWSREGAAPAIIAGNLLGGFLLLAVCFEMAGASAARPGMPPWVRAAAWTGAALLAGVVALGGLATGTDAAGTWAANAHSILGGVALAVVLLVAGAALRQGLRADGAVLLALLATDGLLGLSVAGIAGRSPPLALAHNVASALLMAATLRLAAPVAKERPT